MTSKRVPGHTLRHEGAPHDTTGRRIGSYWRTGSTGAARCSCGQQSDDLPSAAARKAWHRQHKLDVLTGNTPADPARLAARYAHGYQED